ncbi:MAG: cupin [Gammaproteobacteria bacterium]|nr:cupin [Gammaproteobacteria bacterium]
MKHIDTKTIEGAEIVLPCADIKDTLDFFTGVLGFRIDMIYPADAPRIAVISGFGTRLRLDRDSDAPPGSLVFVCRDEERLVTPASPLVAPNGTEIEFRPATTSLELAPLAPSLIVRQMSHDGEWGTGRAGMQYRDLIPGRLGGRYIASHIRIPTGGPVPDYVHHHHILFQMIYCYKGWVRLVYEDQGPSFLMEAGDCVLQPPHIRHRVLECSDGFEVVEIGCPAEHATLVDHDMELPTSARKPDRDFGGQPFNFHKCADAEWIPWRIDGFEMRDTGIAAATDNLVAVVVVRPSAKAATIRSRHDTELLFNFVLQGSMTLDCENGGHWNLVAGDSLTMPAESKYVLSDFSDDLEFLEIVSPAKFNTTLV